MRIALPTYIAGATQTKAYRLLRQKVYETLSAYDLNPTQWSMLGIVNEARDGIRQIDVANNLSVKAPLVTTMTQGMERRGLLQSVQNQFDGRAKLLAVTPTGKKFIREVEQSVSDLLSQLLQGVTLEDMAAYEKVLQAIIKNAASPQVN
jgi:DNA-binding MarR family transcriptional regulator